MGGPVLRILAGAGPRPDIGTTNRTRRWRSTEHYSSHHAAFKYNTNERSSTWYLVQPNPHKPCANMDGRAADLRG